MKGAANTHKTLCAREAISVRSDVKRTTKINASFVRCDEVERLNSSSNPVSALMYWTSFTAMALSQVHKPRRRETRAFPGYEIQSRDYCRFRILSIVELTC